MPNFFNPRAPIKTTHQNLPHRQQSETWIFTTWHQSDSIPQSKLATCEEQPTTWRTHHPEPWDGPTRTEYNRRQFASIDALLDQNTGTSLLRDPANRQIIADTLHHFDGQRYRIASYVIMPNHVHILFSPNPDQQLPNIIQSWKTHTARHINARESRTANSLWQPDYFDRLIRSQDHFQHTPTYITKNPQHLPPTHYTLHPPK